MTVADILQAWLPGKQAAVESALRQQLSFLADAPAALGEAAQYSLLAPGKRLRPLLVLLATGIIMIVAEPARSLKNPAFQLKMGLLIAALIVTSLFQLLHRRNTSFGDAAGSRAAAATLAVVSILLWSSIIFAGRWIAYFA